MRLHSTKTDNPIEQRTTTLWAVLYTAATETDLVFGVILMPSYSLIRLSSQSLPPSDPSLRLPLLVLR